MSSSERFQLVLDKVPEENQPAAAIFLSGCFSLPPASTRGIAASGPIILVGDLSASQADAILAELSGSLPAGVSVRMDEERSGAKTSRLQWPRPPRIYGRDLGDFKRGGEERQCRDFNCPYCGGRVRLVQDEKGERLLGAEQALSSASQSARIGFERDRDPLFSGVKPLADAAGFASIRALQAGDTGFWTDISSEAMSVVSQRREALSGREERPRETGEGTARAAASGIGRRAGKSSAGRAAAGLAAFMKPGAFALILGRTHDAQAVKMASEIMGISEEEARERCLALGLCVARDISLDEAQNLMARFTNAGARARIVKPM